MFEHAFAAERRFELGPRDRPRAEHSRDVARQVEDGRLEADGRRPAVEDQVDPAVEIGEDVLGPGRRDAGSTGSRSAPRSAGPTRSIRPRATCPAGARTPTVSLPGRHEVGDDRRARRGRA